MKLTAVKLPNDYRHPSGLDMGGQWGLYEGTRLAVVDPSFETINQLKRKLENVSGRNEKQDSAGVTSYDAIKSAC